MAPREHKTLFVGLCGGGQKTEPPDVVRRKGRFPLSYIGWSKRRPCLGKQNGIGRIGFAQNATIFSGFIIFGGLGSFAATDFLMAAFFAPLFLALTMVALMHNDLVFLKNRTKRAWANIEVSLKKRADLIPNLEKVVKTYLSQEEGVLNSVAELRRAVVGVKSFTPAEADQAMKREFAVTERVLALREAYPNLKANQMMEDFMNRLNRMENEISMMRAGYNDGVERYLTVKRRIPEVFLARGLNFKDVDLLTFSSEVRAVSQLNLDYKKEIERISADYNDSGQAPVREE